MPTLTRGHEASLEYALETTAGTEASTGTLQIPSDIITNVSITPINNAEVLYAINDYDGISTVTGASEVVISFDYILQQVNTAGEHLLTDSIEYYAVTRTNGQPVGTLTFYYHPIGSSGVTYAITGCVCNSLSKTVNEGDKTLTVSAEFWGRSIASASINYGTLTASSAIANSYEKFSNAGITRGGGTVAQGVSEYSDTVENNLERIPIVGQSTATIMMGNQVNSGSMNVLVTDGGGTTFGLMHMKNTCNIVLNTGTTSNQSETWTFTNTTFTGVPLETTKDTAFVMPSINWVAETVGLAAKS